MVLPLVHLEENIPHPATSPESVIQLMAVLAQVVSPDHVLACLELGFRLGPPLHRPILQGAITDKEGGFRAGAMPLAVTALRIFSVLFEQSVRRVRAKSFGDVVQERTIVPHEGRTGRDEGVKELWVRDHGVDDKEATEGMAVQGVPSKGHFGKDGRADPGSDHVVEEFDHVIGARGIFLWHRKRRPEVNESTGECVNIVCEGIPDAHHDAVRLCRVNDLAAFEPLGSRYAKGVAVENVPG